MRALLLAFGLASLGCGAITPATSTTTARGSAASSDALDLAKTTQPKIKTRNVTLQGVVRGPGGALLGGDRVHVREVNKTVQVGWVGRYKVTVTIPTTTASLTLCAITYGYFNSCDVVAVPKATVSHDFAMERNPAIAFPPPDPTGGGATGGGGPSTCTTSGVFTTCSDGRTCTNSGGVFTSCSGGTAAPVTCTHSGVFTSCSNGVTCTKSGVFTSCSDGSSCTTSGVFTSCTGAFNPTGA